MRAIKEETRGLVSTGVQGAVDRLLDGPNSPVNLGVVIALVYIADGDNPGFHWVTSVQGSEDFDETGVPQEFPEMLATYLEGFAADIRGGALEEFTKPGAEKPADG